MSNANLTLLTTSNVFLDWLTLTNNEANSLNELRNGNYYKDGGNFTVANGAVLITSPTGTALSVTANVSISNALTTNTLSVTGNATVLGGISITAGANIGGETNVQSDLVIQTTPNTPSIRIGYHGPSSTAPLGANTPITWYQSNANLIALLMNQPGPTYLMGLGANGDASHSYISFFRANTINQPNTVNTVLMTLRDDGTLNVLANIITNNVNATSISGNLSATLANVATLNISTALVDVGTALFAGPVAANRAANPGIVLGVGTITNAIVATMNAINSGANNGLWEVVVQNTNGGAANTGQIVFRTGTDDTTTAFNTYLQVNRANVNVTKIIIGNQADSPSINLIGSVNVAGTLAAGAIVTPNAAIYANGTAVVQTSNVNFNNTATINVQASANGATQGNIAFGVNTTASYTWSGPYTSANALSSGGRSFGFSGNDWYQITVNQNSPVNNRVWFEHYSNTGTYELYTTLDNLNASRNFYTVNRSNNIISSITYGNSSDIPPHQFYGNVSINSAFDNKLQLQGTNNPYIGYYNAAGSRIGYIQAAESTQLTISADENIPIVLQPISNVVQISTSNDEKLQLLSTDNPYLSFFNSTESRMGYIKCSNNYALAVNTIQGIPIILEPSDNYVQIYTIIDEKLRLSNSDSPYITFYNAAGSRIGYIQAITSNQLRVATDQDIPIMITPGGINTANIYSNGDVQILSNSSAKAHRDAYSNVGLITLNFSINCAAAVYQDIMLCSNPHITFENAATSGLATTLTLYVRQSSNGSNTVGWQNTIRWSDNNVPILSTAANTADMFTFTTFDGGTIWLGVQVMGNVPLANIW